MIFLITGAEGFIGRNLVYELESNNHQVVAIDKKDGDLTQPGMFDAIYRDRIGGSWHSNARGNYFVPNIDNVTVVHLAAQVGRLFGERDVIHTITSNAQMTAQVARVCRTYGAKLAYASTSEIYGDQGEALCNEGDGPFSLPHNLYGLTKRWGEEVAELYAPKHLVRFRFTMPYGPGVPPGRGRAALPNILWQAYNRIEIPIHRGAERSWCWIGDTVRGVRLVLESEETGAFNVGRDDDSRPLRELAQRACDLTGCPEEFIKDVEPPSAQTVVKRLSTERLRSLGWKPTVEIEDGMNRTLDWVKHFDARGNAIR